MTPSDPFLVRHRRWMLVVLIFFWLLAAALTHIPIPEIPSELDVGDKWVHKIGFAGLASLLMAALLAYRWSRTRRLLLIPLALAVYGALDELTQPSCGRARDFNDWRSDMIGMAVALLVWEAALFVIGRLRPAVKNRD